MKSQHLFTPLSIGSMTVPNRIAMAPMGVEILDEDGHLREPAIRYYEERARGGAGRVHKEWAVVHSAALHVAAGLFAALLVGARDGLAALS